MTVIDAHAGDGYARPTDLERRRNAVQCIAQPWDYVIVTASNAAQGAAYEEQLSLRQTLGLL